MANHLSKFLIFAFLFLNLSLLAAAQGTQFITGACTSDADCQSKCCGFNTGKCAGPVVAVERDGGCGFNGGPAAGGAAAAKAPPKPAPGTQFITGVCTSDADCKSECCGFRTGKCAGAIIALERDGGCGFGDPKSNGNAAAKLRAAGGQQR